MRCSSLRSWTKVSDMRTGKIISLFLILFCAGAVFAGEAEMKIRIKITTSSGNHTLTASLADNSSAKAFAELLKKGPVTVDMHDYGSFEKVGDLPASLPRNDTSITTEPGDIILYQGNKITIYYDTNSWTFTRLGKVEGVSTAQLHKMLGKGNITAVFELSE